jgi:hypothetical protein
MASDQIIHVVSVRHGFVPAIRAVYVSLRVTFALMPRGTVLRIGLADIYDMLIYVVVVRVMQMAVVKVADMVIMCNARVTAFRPVRMGMIFMLWQDTIRIRHSAFP